MDQVALESVDRSALSLNAIKVLVAVASEQFDPGLKAKGYVVERLWPLHQGPLQPLPWAVMCHRSAFDLYVVDADDVDRATTRYRVCWLEWTAPAEFFECTLHYVSTRGRCASCGWGPDDHEDGEELPWADEESDQEPVRTPLTVVTLVRQYGVAFLQALARAKKPVAWATVLASIV